jgi:hypothetical protein
VGIDLGDAHSLQKAGFLFSEVFASRRFTDAQIVSARCFTCRELKESGFGVAELRLAGYAVSDCKAAGFDVAQVRFYSANRNYAKLTDLAGAWKLQ